MCFRSVSVEVSRHILTNLPKQSNFSLLSFLLFMSSFGSSHVLCVLFVPRYESEMSALFVGASP